MRNIHILPTDKPSRLISAIQEVSKGQFKRFYYIRTEYNIYDGRHCVSPQNYNIYITSDEEIKVGDWCFEVHNGDSKANSPKFIDGEGNTWWLRKANANDIAGCPTTKKIILTTDQELVKNGVQAIDDDFLEWFVQNPSCEEVEVVIEKFILQHLFKPQEYRFRYKIIIPKEEPKFVTVNIESATGEDLGKVTYIPLPNVDYTPKQETLEEAAEEYSRDITTVWSINEHCKSSFIEGARWQQERSYSKEDLKNAFECAREFDSLDGIVDIDIILAYKADTSDLQAKYITFEEWFEQNKKKWKQQ